LTGDGQLLSNGLREYGWDAAGRMIPAGDSQYRYNALGLRAG